MNTDAKSTASAGLLAAALLLVAGGAGAGTTVEVVMSGLDHPRGLAFGPEGALYVAEAGRGGSGPCAPMRDVTACYGATGAVSRLWQGQQVRVASGLPSLSDPSGMEVTGPHDISFQGQEAYVTIGFIGDRPDRRAEWGDVGRLLGTLLRVQPGGHWYVDVDVAAYEAEANPAGGPIETNPYGVLVDGNRRYVTDAAANAVLLVAGNGRISTMAAFPSRPFRDTDAVPTGIVRGPDGALYVGELTGAPFLEGGAQIWRIRKGQAPEPWLDGFKTIIDLGFAPDGSLYVLQHATGPMFFAGPGQLIRVGRDGSREVVVEGLDRPTGMVVGPGGEVYVANRGVTAMAGEVLKIVPATPDDARCPREGQPGSPWRQPCR